MHRHKHLLANSYPYHVSYPVSVYFIKMKDVLHIVYDILCLRYLILFDRLT